jgi:hypothetical protein
VDGTWKIAAVDHLKTYHEIKEEIQVDR